MKNQKSLSHHQQVFREKILSFVIMVYTGIQSIVWLIAFLLLQVYDLKKTRYNFNFFHGSFQLFPHLP